MAQYTVEEVSNKLGRLGLRINRSQKKVDATRPKSGVLGIDTLGKLDYLRKEGFEIEMPDYKGRR